jgi:hypothetical protein
MKPSEGHEEVSVINHSRVDVTQKTSTLGTSAKFLDLAPQSFDLRQPIVGDRLQPLVFPLQPFQGVR